MNIDSKLAELAGIMYGDGCLSRCGNKHLIYISGHKKDDLVYHQNITKSLFLHVFDKEVKIKERQDENTLFVRFSDKVIFNLFVSLGMPIGKKADNLRVPLKIKYDSKLFFAFIRGLVDTDGSVIFSKQHRKEKYYPRIELASKSEIFLNEVLHFLRTKGFYGSLSKKCSSFRLEIPGFENMSRWLDLIKFNNPKHNKRIEAQMGSSRLWSDSN